MIGKDGISNILHQFRSITKIGGNIKYKIKKIWKNNLWSISSPSCTQIITLGATEFFESYVLRHCTSMEINAIWIINEHNTVNSYYR